MIPYSEQENSDFLDRVAQNPFRPDSDYESDNGVSANTMKLAKASGDAISGAGKNLAIGTYAGMGSAAFMGLEAARGAGIIPNIPAEREADLDFLKSIKPDPNVSGWFGHAAFGLGKVGTEAVLGAPAGPAGMASMVAATEGYEDFRFKQSEGIDTSTAAKTAALTGFASGVGVLVPGGAGVTLAQRIATGALMNVDLGMAQRGMTGQILRDNGYNDMADQYKTLDAMAMFSDAVLGGGFGLLSKLHDRTEKPIETTYEGPSDRGLLAIENAPQDATFSEVPKEISGPENLKQITAEPQSGALPPPRKAGGYYSVDKDGNAVPETESTVQQRDLENKRLRDIGLTPDVIAMQDRIKNPPLEPEYEGPSSEPIDAEFTEIPSDTDAALAVNNIHHLEIESAPGIPANVASRNAHVQAMDVATQNLMEDKPVDVANILVDKQFVVKPAEQDTYDKEAYDKKGDIYPTFWQKEGGENWVVPRDSFNKINKLEVYFSAKNRSFKVVPDLLRDANGLLDKLNTLAVSQTPGAKLALATIKKLERINSASNDAGQTWNMLDTIIELDDSLALVAKNTKDNELVKVVAKISDIATDLQGAALVLQNQRKNLEKLFPDLENREFYSKEYVDEYIQKKFDEAKIHSNDDQKIQTRHDATENLIKEIQEEKLIEEIRQESSVNLPKPSSMNDVMLSKTQRTIEKAFHDDTKAPDHAKMTEEQFSDLEEYARNLETEIEGRKSGKLKAPETPNKPVKPTSLMQFIAKNGGIKDTGGDLKAMGLEKKFILRYGKLVRKNGLSPDEIALRAWEEGYFGSNTETGERPSINDLYELMEREHLKGAQVRNQDVSSQADAADDKKLTEEMDSIHNTAQEYGIEIANKTRDELVNSIKVAEESEAFLTDYHDDIMEEAAMREYYGGDKDLEPINAPDEGVPFFEESHEAATRRTSETQTDEIRPDILGQQSVEQGANGREAGGSSDTGGTGSPQTERVKLGGKEFDQGIMPGMGKSAKQAAAGRDAKFQGRKGTTKEQKDADDGLFAMRGDEDQLFDMADQIIAETPDMNIVDEDGNISSAAEAMAKADENIAKSADDANLFGAAIDCFLRNGS